MICRCTIKKITDYVARNRTTEREVRKENNLWWKALCKTALHKVNRPVTGDGLDTVGYRQSRNIRSILWNGHMFI